MTIDIDSHYPLTADQVASFRENGFIKLRDVLSRATLAFYGREITRLTIALNTQDKPLEERSTYDKAFLQVMNLWERSPLVGRFVMGQRLARIAAELLEVKGVRLYHDQSLYKEPGGGITPAHADQYYWPLCDRPYDHGVDSAAGGAAGDGSARLLSHAASRSSSVANSASPTRARPRSAPTWRVTASST